MTLQWERESAPTWDADKQRIVGGAPEGAFDLAYAPDAPVAGEWWAVRDGDAVVGYGWLDIAWGDAEILLATAPDAQRRGVGAFVLDNIEAEAAKRGVNYVYNTIRAGHPDRVSLREWLESHGFEGGDDGSLRKRITSGSPAPAAHPVPAFDASVDRGPGSEESGGYVNPEDHRY
ncbi:GNAT family N-acetyltransferase [Gordonia phthalatica]|uniref:GNAT family N-acetyltransferase n=1 Tax=Gordonia phthalatica TaxID=1136941 RepID=UPI0007808498|nr:GNAT family N-acetyltransferase [Gordonia phthalatica]